jgi:hypothetical protein
MKQRNDDPATRYEVELDCGHTRVQQFPPLAYNDTRLGIRTVRTVAA